MASWFRTCNSIHLTCNHSTNYTQVEKFIFSPSLALSFLPLTAAALRCVGSLINPRGYPVVKDQHELKQSETLGCELPSTPVLFDFPLVLLDNESTASSR